jgi:hypothetical protein
VARDLLNSVPEGLLAVVFVGGVVIVAVGASLLVSRRLASWRSRSAAEVVLGVAAMAMTLFALVLAFVVVNLYSDSTTASGDVTDEANALGAVVQDARAFPAPNRRSINRAVATYVQEVRTREFKGLADGEHDPVAEGRALAIVGALQAYEPRPRRRRPSTALRPISSTSSSGSGTTGLPRPGRRSRPRCLGC